MEFPTLNIMFAISVLLVLLATAFLLERFVKSRTARTAAIVLFVIVSFGIGSNIGTKLGKVEQLNQFARLLPRAMMALDPATRTQKELETARAMLQVVVSDPEKLDNLESVMNEIEILQDANNSR